MFFSKAPTDDAAARPHVAEQLVSLCAPDSFAADQYRTLRLTIERHHRGGQLQVVAITSPGPADGKSVTTLNVAGVLAQSADTRVLVIDADLRRPSVAAYLGGGIRPTPGLAEAIAGSGNDLGEWVQRLDRFNLSVLPAGAPHAAPYELLNSPRVEMLLTEARRRYDYVVIDTPPLLPFPDCGVLGRHIEGYLLTVAAHRTRRKLLTQALAALDPAKVLGIVFNGDDQPRGRHYGYYYDNGSSSARERTRGW
jgi:capsular exopolysaccharide synthesis family protein